MPVKILEVNDDNDGRRLDNYLMSIYKEIPKSKIYSIIRKGEVRVNSGRVKPNTKISSGDLVRIPPYLNEDRNGPKHKVNISLKTLITDNIIFEDNNFIIINKPYGIAVHGGTKNNIGIIDVVRSIYDNSIDLCHRIDKETSGCLVLSKNKKSNKWFNKLLLDKKIKKKYIAILKGHLNSNKEIKSLINKSETSNKKSFISDDGKESVSIFIPKLKLNSSCLVEIEIFTGRTHQIRVQSNHIGHPVLNDNKYGDIEFNNQIAPKNIKRMALHSMLIEFYDMENKLISIKAELDDSFLNLIEGLK
ncbi:RluA family pseudouridine synthase [Gammaproteobacteria bacterium]|nr:RluA family pseudouridine synthase [Gammaproteobacteria bacterium]MDC3368266.1 RluA family pseudouridine synthase [Gammaproteobacteria bacterium]